MRAFWAGDSAPAFRVREGESSSDDDDEDGEDGSGSSSSSESDRSHSSSSNRNASDTLGSDREEEEDHSRQRSDATERGWLESENEAEEQHLEELRDTEAFVEGNALARAIELAPMHDTLDGVAQTNAWDIREVGSNSMFASRMGFVPGARFHRTAAPRRGRADPERVTTSDEEEAIDLTELRRRRRGGRTQLDLI